MALSNDISVNAKVSIGNKGLGIVKVIVHRGFKLADMDFEVELLGERLTIINNDAGNEDAGCQQTTEQTSRSTSRFNIVSENDVDEFKFQHTNKKNTNQDCK